MHCLLSYAKISPRLKHIIQLPPVPSLHPPAVQSASLIIRKTFATEAHLIDIFIRQHAFAVFKHSESSQGSSNTNARPPPLAATRLVPVLKGSFPWPISENPHIIPREPTSFAMVVIPLRKRSIHVFLFTPSELESTVEEICSVDIPGGLISLVLPTPPPTAHYALGCLAMGQVVDGVLSHGIVTAPQLTHFAVRIDFPSPGWDSSSGNQGCLTLRRMDVALAVGERQVIPRQFDHFSGKIWFSVSSYTGGSDLIVDYISY